MSIEAANVCRPSPGKSLRTLFHSLKPELFIGVQDALTAKIAAAAGADGIWASGLGMSAAMALRDANEASWTQVLDAVELIADGVSIPVILDGDTGYGNFNNARRLVRKLESRGIAGVCIEDKLFPKTNSFLKDGQELADIDEFCGKISACKDTQLTSDFCLIARTEAFIAGFGLDEALKRAHRYADAGADAILVHSKGRTPDEVFAFARDWGDRLPVLLVPTTYGAAATQSDYQAASISGLIWANHAVRASISAMRAVCRQIVQGQPIGDVEQSIAPLADIFSLTDVTELEQAEARYLPKAPASASRPTRAKKRA